MPPTASIQQVFLDQLKKHLPGHLSLADEMAEILNISRDSAYRRIRGETILSLDEVNLLARKFSLSIDSILSSVNDMISFKMVREDMLDVSLSRWLQGIINHLEFFERHQEVNKKLISNAKDLPIFHYLQFSGLATFKMYFWLKFFDRDAFNNNQYNPAEVSKENIALARKVWDRYAALDSIEIITEETLMVTLRQIEYAHDCGLFSDVSVPQQLLHECLSMSHHLKKQASMGRKLYHGSDEPLGKYEVYLNQVVNGDNSTMFHLGEKRVAITTSMVFRIMSTTNDYFCKLSDAHLTRLMDKSSLISVVGEKERLKFFRRIDEEIARTADRIKQ